MYVIVLVIPMCYVMNPIAAETKEPYKLCWRPWCI